MRDLPNRKPSNTLVRRGTSEKVQARDLEAASRGIPYTREPESARKFIVGRSNTYAGNGKQTEGHEKIQKRPWFEEMFEESALPVLSSIPLLNDI